MRKKKDNQIMRRKIQKFSMRALETSNSQSGISAYKEGESYKVEIANNLAKECNSLLSGERHGRKPYDTDYSLRECISFQWKRILVNVGSYV